MLRGASAALAVLVAVAASGSALHFCDDPPLLDVAGQVYVFVDCTPATGNCDDYLFSMWIYMETNGEPGAQRGGHSTASSGDVCQNSVHPDTSIPW